MPFTRPDLATLIARAQADMQSRLPGARPQLRRSLTGVIARMEGGVAHGLYGYLDWLAAQLMPDTADAEHLERWAAIWGRYRKAAGYAGGTVTVAGAAGAVLPEGTALRREDGVPYVTTAEALIAKDGAARVAVRAVEPGPDGNAPAGTALALAAPVPGVRAEATAEDGLTGGTAEESDAALRQRLLMYIQRTPMGGTLKDYETWALEVPGVTRAFVAAGEMGKGTVTVRFMMDGTYPDGIPREGDRKVVAEHIETLRPVTADVFVALPVADPLDLRLSVTPDSAAVRNAVEAQVWAAVRRDAVPGGAVLLSRLHEAISIAEGEEDHVIHAPTANIIPAAGHIVVPGGITWVSA